MATYYINIPSMSKIELHPFTAATTESATIGPVLLFQQGPERKKAKRNVKEWTRKVGNMVDTTEHKGLTLKVCNFCLFLY